MGKSRGNFTAEELLHAAEIFNNMAAAATEAATQGKDICQTAKEHELKYLDLARCLDIVRNVPEDDTASPPKLSSNCNAQCLPEPYEVLYCKIFGVNVSDRDTLKFPPDAKESLDYIRQKLLSEQENVVLDCTALGKSPSEIGKELNLTTAKVYYAEKKAFQKLRNPNACQLLQYGIAGRDKIKEEEDKAAEVKRQEFDAWLEKSATEAAIHRQEREVGQCPIEKLGLSVLPYLALRKIGCKTIIDLHKQICYHDLTIIDGLGAAEIEEILSQYTAFLKYVGADELIEEIPVNVLEGKILPSEEIAEIMRNVPLSELNLTATAYNALYRVGCDTLGDIDQLLRRKTINNVRGLGTTSINKIAKTYFNELHALGCEEYAQLVLRDFFGHTYKHA